LIRASEFLHDAPETPLFAPECTENSRESLVKLVQTLSPQTDLLEAESRVFSLIKEVIKAELERSGFVR